MEDPSHPQNSGTATGPAATRSCPPLGPGPRVKVPGQGASNAATGTLPGDCGPAAGESSDS
eukprot:10864348-Heterocapsa_arctica.AAC.1